MEDMGDQGRERGRPGTGERDACCAHAAHAIWETRDGRERETRDGLCAHGACTRERVGCTCGVSRTCEAANRPCASCSMPYIDRDDPRSDACDRETCPLSSVGTEGGKP